MSPLWEDGCFLVSKAWTGRLRGKERVGNMQEFYGFMRNGLRSIWLLADRFDADEQLSRPGPGLCSVFHSSRANQLLSSID
jgi:hypothetical protein